MNRSIVILGAMLACSAAPVGAQTTAKAGGGDRPWLDFPASDRSLLIVSATLNGQPVKAMVDSGAAGVVVSKDFAISHDLELKDIGSAYSIGGPTRFYTTPRIQLTVDGIVGPTAPVQVTAFDAFATDGRSFDVVIGASFIAAFGLEIDFDHHRLRFQPAAEPTASSISVPFRYDGRQFSVAGLMSGQAVAPLFLDLGSTASLSVALPALTASIRRGLPSTDVEYRGLGGSEIDPIVTVPDFAIGEASFGAVSASLQSPGVTNDRKTMAGAIGLGILARYNVGIDPQRSRLLLTPRTVALGPEIKSTVGVQGDYRPDWIVVTHVMKNSPAERAGIHAGNVICAVDGVAVVDAWRTSPMLHWGTVGPGHVYMIRLCSGRIVEVTTAAFY